MAEKATNASSALLYSTRKFDDYFKQLKALCKKSQGGRILSKLAVHPIYEFIELQTAKFKPDKESSNTSEESDSSESSAEDADDDTSSEEDGEDSLIKEPKKLVKNMEFPDNPDKSTKTPKRTDVPRIWDTTHKPGMVQWSRVSGEKRHSR